MPFEVTGDGSAPERPETPEIPEVPESLTPAAPPATAVAGSPSYTG